MSRIAVVTGSNKGIGFACVRALCKQMNPNDVVYLTSRNPELGKKAVEDLKKEGLSPQYHQLDITNKQSITALRDHIQSSHGGLDILINNAAIAFKMDDTTPFSIQAKDSVKVNLYATLDVYHTLLPLLKENARVVNVSSMVSKFSFEKLSPEMKEAFRNCKEEGDVIKLLDQFVELAQEDKHVTAGFSSSAYGMSKLGLTVMTQIHGATIGQKTGKSGIVVSAICPGYVDTDMTSHKGTKTIDQGADTPVWVALQPPGSDQFQGKFITERKLASFL